MRFEFIADEAAQDAFPVDYMCSMLGVSRQGYYAWKRRGPSRHAQDDATLKTKIKAIFDHHRGRYGVRRIFRELTPGGVAVAYKRVARLMAELGLVSVHRRPGPRTTIPADRARGLPDLVGGDVGADAVNETWFGDITSVRTWDGFAYVASVLDACSRKVVGWAVADHMRTELVQDALRMALDRRRPAEGVIFHSDRGSQYTSDQFLRFCRRTGVRNSVGRTGICFDNAAAESFWATLKKEFVHLHPFDTVARLRKGVFEYIEVYYNRQRIYSGIGYVTLVEFEEGFDNQVPLAA